MPVEVVEEFDAWRKIRDEDGTIGWVHKTMIDGRRNVMIIGKTAQIVRASDDKESRPIIKVEPTVVARLVECGKEWCKVQVDGRKGWIEKKALWGVYPNEIID